MTEKELKDMDKEARELYEQGYAQGYMNGRADGRASAWSTVKYIMETGRQPD